MRGYFPQGGPNDFVRDKWVGKTVAYNGSDRTAEVLRAYWQGPGQPVQLSVSEDGGEPFLTDSEHATIVRDRYDTTNPIDFIDRYAAGQEINNG